MSDEDDPHKVIPFGEERARRHGCAVVRERVPPAIIRIHDVVDEEEVASSDPIEKVHKARIALADAERDLHVALREEARAGMNDSQYRVVDAHNDLLLRLLCEVPWLRRIAEDEGLVVATMEQGLNPDYE